MTAVAAQPTWRADYGALAMEGVERLFDAPALTELPLADQLELRVHGMYIRRFLSPACGGGNAAERDLPNRTVTDRAGPAAAC